MKQLITPNWQPPPKTVNALIAGGWSEEQRNRNLIKFVFDKRYANKEIEGAGSLYSSWVRFETPRNKKEKKIGKALKEILAKQQDKSKDGKQRAQEAKQQTNVMSQAEVEDFYNKRHLGE